MSWWGKVVGGAFGFMLGGPLGAVMGAAMGHKFDQGLNGLDDADLQGLNSGQQERVQSAFFAATFSVMGHIAKADGKVTSDEIRAAEQMMGQMQLDAEQRKVAINLFNEGKQEDFPLEDVVEQLRRECHRRRNLIQMFIEIQLFAAYADGEMHVSERRVLADICSWLRFSQQDFTRLDNMARAQAEQVFGGAQQGKPSIDSAYTTLGVAETANKAEIKKAYRRLMSQHHPDKLVAKGLPEEMMKMASEKTHEIRQAYETIKKDRGF